MLQSFFIDLNAQGKYTLTLDRCLKWLIKISLPVPYQSSQVNLSWIKIGNVWSGKVTMLIKVGIVIFYDNKNASYSDSFFVKGRFPGSRSSTYQAPLEINLVVVIANHQSSTKLPAIPICGIPSFPSSEWKPSYASSGPKPSQVSFAYCWALDIMVWWWWWGDEVKEEHICWYFL